MSFRVLGGGFISSPSAQIQPSTTPLQILRTNAAADGVEWATLSVPDTIICKSVSWTGQQTIDGALTDVTDATLTITGLDAAETYDIDMIATLSGSIGASGAGELQAYINGSSAGIAYTEVPFPQTLCVSGVSLGVTGVTSVICKLRAADQGSGTFLVGFNSKPNSIIAKAVQR